jgi:ribosomal protein S18 acetylase RimI-like enzyme
VKNWWNETQIRRAVKDGLVTVAEAAGCVIGVAQRGRYGSAHVLFKLYVDPAYRGRGLGSDLVSNVIDRLRPEAERLCVEHFAGNVRAAAFYEREGFFVERVEPHGASPALDVVWRARKL